MLSQSGTFKMQDFKLNAQGLAFVDIGDAESEKRPAAASPGSVEVTSMAELETLEELGSGASGVVFKMKHKPTGEIVAVKQVTILEKPKREQVVSELKIMRKHQCPWLVALYNAFYEEAKVYTILEFMDAGSLADLVNKHPSGLTDERELGKIGMQLLNGLHYLHRQHHQVHRDLKPANVMLNSKGAVKISDFGISSQLDSTAGMCETFVGTTCYMAPERLSGDRYSYSSDIWSFGLIMLELASGRYPYKKANSYFELLGQIMDQDAPHCPEGDLSDFFGEFVGLCLDKEPARRPAARDLLKHPWLRQYPVMDDLLLSGLLEGMSLG